MTFIIIRIITHQNVVCTSIQKILLSFSALLMPHEKLRHLVAEPAQRNCNNGVQNGGTRSKRRISVVLASTVQSSDPVSQMQVNILFVDVLKTDTPKVWRLNWSYQCVSMLTT